MNERMQELADEAWKYANDNSADGDNRHGRLYTEKYTQLIVKECMTLCDEQRNAYYKRRLGTADFDVKTILAEGENALEKLHHKLKKHFGVK